MKRVHRAVCVLLSSVLSAVAHAGGPRFVTGSNFPAVGAGKIMAFYTPNVTYFTDPGDLAANVTHAQADTMVAAAAAPWNNSYALLTLNQGGLLAEHISSQDAYFNGTSLVLPADAQPTNYLAKPIAVVYDTDGSVIDLLIGSGASDPSACRQNAVIESVDGTGPTGNLQHAIILLNGRCVGSAPEQLMQMQYQLERVFGRVLGLAWAQVNDNVFTAVNTVTQDQENNWPIMHPIDVICGTYTYQCMRYPFQLRPDDISSLARLYPVTGANIVPGKSYTDAPGSGLSIEAICFFPANQIAMESMNMTVRWGETGAFFNSFDTLSAVSGDTFQRNGGNPVDGRTIPAGDNAGAAYGDGDSRKGSSQFARLPFVYQANLLMDGYVFIDAINPLYSGEYALGIYEGTPYSLAAGESGPTGLFSSGVTDWNMWVVASGEPNSCATGNDGSEKAPAAFSASGWWTGLLCGIGHTSWFSIAVKPSRTWTLEVTATSESGSATLQKARPVLGIWNAADPTGALPTVATVQAAFNSTSLGMTQLRMPAATQAQSLRIAVTDQFGKGRPDFSYNARLLYADSIAPAVVGSGGGQVTLTGTGFRAGNQVAVGGVGTTVISWSATQIVFLAPPLAAIGLAVGAAADITVTDASTAGQTTISGALSYTSATDVLKLITAPASLQTGLTSATSFAVKVFASDGVTPIPAASVSFTVSANAALTACGAASSCNVPADINGLAQTNVSGLGAGSVTLTAREVSGGASVSVTLADADPIRAVTSASAPLFLAAGAHVSFTASVAASLNGTAAPGVPVLWTTTGGLTPEANQSMTGATGVATIGVQSNGITAPTATSVTGCAWTTQCASMTANIIVASLWTASIVSGAGQTVRSTGTLAPVTLLITDGSGHPLLGATVQIYQTVDAWQSTCPTHGACPAAPVIAKAATTAVSDANGNISIVPLQVANTPQVVNIAASTGTMGFVTLTLDVTP